VTRYQASRDDLAVYVAMSGAPSAPHTARWYAHISALLGSRYGRHAGGRQRRSTLPRSTLPDASTARTSSFPGKAVGVSVGGAASAASSGAPAAAAAPAKPAVADDDSDDELDLFGDDTEEEKAAKQAVIDKAKARGVEKAKLSKSMIVLDVKPWDDETVRLHCALPRVWPPRADRIPPGAFPPHPRATGPG
jgi:elongation factor 1-beta